MIFLLSFLISWLSGMFMILMLAFFSYEQFSIIDITSFAVLMLAGCIIVIPLLYLFFLKFLEKRICGNKQFICFPATLILLANLPVYYITWSKINDLYGKSEGLLLVSGFVTTGLMFGLLWAWKNKTLNKFEKL